MTCLIQWSCCGRNILSMPVVFAWARMLVFFFFCVLPVDIESFPKTSLVVTVQSFQVFLVYNPYNRVGMTRVWQTRSLVLISWSQKTQFWRCSETALADLVSNIINYIYFLGKLATQVGQMSTCSKDYPLIIMCGEAVVVQISKSKEPGLHASLEATPGLNSWGTPKTVRLGVPCKHSPGKSMTYLVGLHTILCLFLSYGNHSVTTYTAVVELVNPSPQPTNQPNKQKPAWFCP